MAVNIGNIDLKSGSTTKVNNLKGNHIGGITREGGANVKFGKDTNIVDKG